MRIAPAARWARRALAQNSADTLLGGRLSLRQPARGHRAGTDAVLLGASVPVEASGKALDAGAGVGSAGLVALARGRRRWT